MTTLERATAISFAGKVAIVTGRSVGESRSDH
jgi:hypothetical protein